MVRHDVLQLIKPPQAQRGENLSLVWNRRRQHPVVSRDAIGGYKKQSPLWASIEISHLAGIDVRVTVWQLISGGRYRHLNSLPPLVIAVTGSVRVDSQRPEDVQPKQGRCEQQRAAPGRAPHQQNEAGR